MTGVLEKRVLVVWCPDWPVVAAAGEAGLPDRLPAAVFHANLVQACNEPARALGVRRGMRRRDAQGRCPELAVLAASPERDARAFEDVLVAVEQLRPGIAPLRPGLVALRSPGRFYGGEEEAGAVLAERLVTLGVWDSRTGVADELFTAEQAARRARSQESLVVPAGGSPDFLRTLPVEVLDDPDAVSLLRRLGLRTLGDLGRLRAADVRDRFGSHVAWVHRVVGGDGAVHLPTRTPPPELERHVDFEPPLDSAETIVFSARRTAEAFVAGLAQQGLVCTEVRVEARCEGEDPEGRPASVRSWLHPRFFTAADLVDRLHWQLQGGFRAGDVSRPVERVRFVPETVVPDAVHADVLWGGTDERVERGIARVQGMLGHDAVVVPVLQGGRGPADRQAWVPWGERPTGLRPTGPPWPGSLPPPAPARVLRTPWPAEVYDAARRPVALDDRGALSADPAVFRPGPDEDRQPVAAWAGPWVVEEQWWESGGRRVARFQVVGVDGRAWLLTLDGDVWWTEAGYD
ncbi:DNA polymerase Y family protein [Nocardioides lianchengensis]|uniref:Protein ImuB n=1 Tax=Nocardioides lianchengensis TaxID=1045774 RepID=A0A1G6WY91_9ACTN|nr:DNA polymerase Y family protein [Nocardioides lianchengensis]NYG09177.1 protein ImuB [Nocardioides lianchengensis]SDD70167.1 protein ImuB [Nocardioides lianchengensis]